MSEQPVTCLPPPLPPKTKSRRPFQENSEESEQNRRNSSGNNSDKDEILISASYSSHREHQKSSRSSAITTVNLNTVDLNIPDGFQELTYSCKNSGKSHVVKILINPEETRLVDDNDKKYSGLNVKKVNSEVPSGETCIRISVNNNSEIYQNNNMVDTVGRSSPSHYFFNQYNSIMSSGQMSPSDTLDSGTCSDLDGTPPPLPKKKSSSGVSVTMIGSHKKTASLSSGAEVDSDDNESHSSTSSISCDSLNCGKVSPIGTKIINGSKSKSSTLPQTLLHDIRQRKESYSSSLVDEKSYEDRQKESSIIETQQSLDHLDSDMYFDFHMNEKEHKNDTVSVKSVIEDETFAGYKDLLGGDKAATIRSAKGTVRGVKNRVRAGIATFLQINSPDKDQLVKFWEVEEVSAKKPWSIEEQECEDHFVKNVYTNSDGRFVVSIPFKESPESLGESHFTAVKRFLALERRLLVNDKLRKLYTDFMSEYESLGHMTEVNDTLTHDLNEPEYFMPHHGVEKKLSSTTSKLRVVFNASSPTSTGLSLNDLQMTGPIIQQELISIILRFRMRPIVLSSDIRMMYRQVLVNPEQRRLQKIVWRDSPDKPIKTYELNTVTYGTTAASFLAIRCLHQIAYECEKEFPEIANIIRNDMYVDDLLTSVDTVEEAKYVYDNISNIFLKYGFELRKWKSNQKNIIPDLNQTDYGNVDFVIDKQTEPKTLGLSWECENDVLTYKIQRIDNETNITKRVILSKIASIFDPLGLLSPCIILAKVLLQKLWSENLEWDELVPKHVLDAWLNFSKDLNALNTLKISRMVTCKNPIYIALHAFADASEASYGACIYIVAYDSQNNRVSNLLCAKSKVAPVKTLTIPRLELCAALVLAKLISKCLEALNITFDETYCWTDSTIVLGWLKTTPNLLKPFVSNRVATIQNLTNRFHWRHVPTADNPADIVSRGLLPSQLINSKMWFHGPPWLCDPSAWPKTEVTLPELPEKRKICLSIIPIIADFDFDRYSSLNKLKRSFAYVLRFIRNCRVKPEQRNFNFLSVEELDESFNTLIKIAQRQSFSDDYIVLKKGHTLPNNSKILSLHPFIDANNILRVGGRLTNSDLPYSKKHPILLSSIHKLTRLIFEYEHVKLLHAGPQLLLSTIRDFFWPISGRNLARKTVKNCVKCARYNPQSVQPIMGNLPNARIKQSPPFSVVGVDYAGPFVMKDRRGRGCKPIKCWVALFVCFSTRALHLEIVLSLSCDDFLQAFNRFVSRRGKPTEVFSDNGTNFVKANKELKEMGEFLASNYSNICDSAANLGIRWHFIPTNSPHFGGIWEAGVKSVKYHLRRVLGSSMIFFYDFQTLLTRIEAILNSRPLSPLSSNPDDLTPLTPAHFLIGRSTMHIQEVPLREIPENRLSQFQVLQKLYEHFWQRWSREYLSELQPRRRWKKNQGAIDVGQLVLVKDDNLPPAMWRLGRIMDLVRGKDGVSRVASLKTANGMVSRAVTRLVPLPV